MEIFLLLCVFIFDPQIGNSYFYVFVKKYFAYLVPWLFKTAFCVVSTKMRGPWRDPVQGVMWRSRSHGNAAPAQGYQPFKSKARMRVNSKGPPLGGEGFVQPSEMFTCLLPSKINAVTITFEFMIYWIYLTLK